MAIDAMEIDSHIASPAANRSPEKERKRKHKDSSSPSKKKRKHTITDEEATPMPIREKKSSNSTKKSASSKSQKKTTPAESSPYTLTTATLYLPLSPISISPTHAQASLMAEHLSPLLLTYYPPLQGIVLAYSNVTISSTPPNSPESAAAAAATEDHPQPLTLARTAGEYGVLYVYLTATFLVFRPQRGQLLEGWVNVQSEGFLGAIALNLFSVGIERKRLPSDWKWIPPGDEQEDESSTTTTNNTSANTSAKTSDATNPTSTSSDDDDDNSEDEESDTETKPKFDPALEHFTPVTLASDANPLNPLNSNPSTDSTPTTNAAVVEDNNDDDDDGVEGYFQSVSGHRVRGTIKFRVVDIDVIPGSERDRGFISIEGTMLTPEEEARVLEDERNGILSSGLGGMGTPQRRYGSVDAPSVSFTVPLSAAKADRVDELREDDDEGQGNATAAAAASAVDTPSKSSSSKPKKEKKSKSSSSSASAAGSKKEKKEKKSKA
ncbi:DNA-directed RNA polymerase I subunit RPA43 [Aspergillus homomorphus CBS 101889]|uniref:DNA-directed RNA polymerase subunit n=1 Tax=Aspergillus homomorphus (strain CBS 101889) TaxID=1450537 RepID=A0A395HQW4_ASPHC|nr:hypothetical protein BO97DRAFT_408175 [Aspergillus homomorphus CBS 101889]RAL08644.1 hypothetical protein BO97DRAFT_408175 [Aspergillus homomorphus CBS 101889]